MPIKIEVTEPELLPPSTLKHLAAFFLALGGVAFASETVTKNPPAADGEQDIYAGVAEKMLAVLGGKLDADHTIGKAPELGMGYGLDNEASTTAGDHHIVLHADGAQAFAPAATDDPAAVFGGEAPKPAAAVAPTPPAPVAPVAPTAPTPPAPVAPVAPTAPANTAPAAPIPNSEIAIDKAGLPWDRRIHSESKSINKTDGLWRTKRGVDPELVKTVEAELRNVMTIPKPGPTPTPTVDPAPVAPTAPTAPVAPASAQASTTPKNLGELMIVAQQLVASGKIASLDVVRATAAGLGVVALPLLGTRPDMVAAVYNKLIEA